MFNSITGDGDFPAMESTEELKRIFLRRGIKIGLRQFAWWKDGVEYVGTCGCTLERAIQDVDSGKYDEYKM
jgi:hypothetical protein